MDAHKSDSVFAWITGLVLQVVGMITLEGVIGIIMPLVFGLVGGFLGYLGKEIARRLVKKYFPSKDLEE